MTVTVAPEIPVRQVRSMPAELGALIPVRHALATALERRGWERDDVARVVLCAVEGMANAVEHGSPAGGSVGVEFEVTSDLAQLRVLDQGRTGAEPPALDRDVPSPRACHGRGLALIRGLSDDAQVRRRGAGTELRLRFRRDPAIAEVPPWAA